MKLKTPSVSLLKNLLLCGSLKKKEDFLKAVRMYLIIMATYDEDGFTCENYSIKLDYQTDRDFDYQKKELYEKKSLEFNIHEWFTYLVITVEDSEQNNYVQTGFDLSAKNKQQRQKSIKRENIITLLNLTIEEILFDSNLEEKKIFIKDFKEQFGRIDSVKIEELFGSEDQPVYPFRNQAQTIEIGKLESKEQTKKINNLIRTYRNDFNTLDKKQWFIFKENGSNKQYQQQEETDFSDFIERIFIDNDESVDSTNSDNSIYALNYNLTNFINKFHKNLDNSRLIITSEYATKTEDEQILDDLERNWFELDDEVAVKSYKPILLESQSFKQPQVVYPVSFVYIQRAPYLYFIYQRNDNSIGWDGIRSDRLISTKLLTWENPDIPSVLLNLPQKNNCFKQLV